MNINHNQITTYHDRISDVHGYKYHRPGDSQLSTIERDIIVDCLKTLAMQKHKHITEPKVYVIHNVISIYYKIKK